MWYGSRTIANKLQEEDQTPADDTYEDDFAFSSDDGGGHGTNGSSREHTNGREKETEHINTRTADNEQSTEKSWSSSSDAYSRDAYEGDEGEEEEEEQLEGEGGRKTGKIDRKATASATLRKKRRERREGRKKQRQKAAMTMKVEETCPASTSTFETVQQQRANEGRRKETEENKNREVDDIEVAKDISDEISPLLQTSEEERSKQTKRSVDHMEIVTEMDKPTEYHNHHILTKNGGEEKEEGRLNHMLRTPDSKQSAPGKCKDGKTSLPVSGFKSRRSAKHRREIRKRNNGTSKSDGKSWGNSNGKNHSGKNHGQRKGRTDIDIDMNDRNENSTYERNNKPRRRRTESRYGSHTSVVNTHEKEKGNDEATDERLNIHSASYIRSKYEGLMKSSHPYAQQRGKHRRLLVRYKHSCLTCRERQSVHSSNNDHNSDGNEQTCTHTNAWDRDLPQQSQALLSVRRDAGETKSGGNGKKGSTSPYAHCKNHRTQIMRQFQASFNQPQKHSDGHRGSGSDNTTHNRSPNHKDSNGTTTLITTHRHSSQHGNFEGSRLSSAAKRRRPRTSRSHNRKYRFCSQVHASPSSSSSSLTGEHTEGVMQPRPPSKLPRPSSSSVYRQLHAQSHHLLSTHDQPHHNRYSYRDSHTSSKRHADVHGCAHKSRGYENHGASMSASLVNEHISTKPSASSAAVKSSSINSVYVTRIMHDLCTTTRELTVLREAHIKAVQKLALYAKREEGEGEGMGNNVNGDGVGNKVGRSKGEKGEEDNYSDEYEHENEHHNDGDSNIDTSNGSNNDFHSNTNNESSEHAGEANKADDNHTENADTDSRKEESETEKRSPVITAERGDEEAASVMVNGTLNRKHLDVSTLEALSRSIVQERRRSTIAGKSALVQRLQLEIRQLKRELSKERKEREEQCEKVLAQEKDLKASRVKISKLKLDVNREKTNTRKLEKLQGEMKDGWEEYVAQAEKQIEKESKSRERQERKQKKMLMMHTKRERELTIQIRGLETEKQVLADDNGALRQREGEAEGQVEKARSELLRVQRLLDTERKERKERDTINVRVDEKKAPNAVNNAHSYCDSTAGIDAAAAADGEDDSQTEERNEYRKERDDLMIKIEALKAQLIDLLQQQQQHERREERQAKEREDRKEHTRLVDNRSDGKDSGDDDKDYEYDDEFEDDDGEGDIEAKQVYDGNDTNGNDNDCTGANTSAKSKAEGHVANADLAETKTNAYQDVQKLKQRVIEQDTIIKQLQQEREKTMKENRKEKEKKKEKRVIDTLEKETVILSKIEQLMKNLERKRKENKKLKTELDLFEQKFTTLIQINAQAQTRVATTTMTCDGGASGNIYDNSNAMGGTINGENDVRTDSSHITKSTFCKASEKSEGKEMTKMKINDAIREKEDIIQGQRWEIIREKEERLLETEEELRTQKLLLSQKNDVLKQRLTRLTQKEQELRVKADELREKNSVLDEKEQELVVKREDINMINVLLEERDTLILQKEEQLRVLRAETQAGKEASDVENGIKTETTKEERRNEDNVMVAGDTSSEEESENEYDDEDAFESEDSDSDVFRLVSVLPLSTPIQLPSSVVSVAAQEQQGRDQSRSVSVERETKDQQLEGRMTKGTQQERQQAVQEKKRSREHEKLAIKVKDIAGDTEHSRDDCNIEVEADSEERRKEMREHVSEILAMKTELANAQTALRMSQDRYGVLEYSYHEQNIVIDNQKQELLRVKFQYQDAIANRKKREAQIQSLNSSLTRLRQDLGTTLSASLTSHASTGYAVSITAVATAASLCNMKQSSRADVQVIRRSLSIAAREEQALLPVPASILYRQFAGDKYTINHSSDNVDMGSVDGSCPRAKGKRESAITAILSGVSHTGGDPLKKTSSPSLFRSNSSSLNDRGGDTQASPATITGNSGTSGSASDDGSSNARHNAGEHFIDSLDRIRTSEGKRARTSAAASSLRRIVKTPSLHIRLQVACGKLFSRWSPVDPPNACVILMIMDRSLPLPSWQYVDETESVENDTFPHFEHLFDLHLKPMDEIKFVVYDVDMAPPVGDDEVGYCCAWTNQLIHHSVTGTPTATITDISVAAGSVPVSVSSSSPVLSRSLSSLLNPPPPMKLRLTSDDPARRKELSDVGAFLTLSIRH